jgi:monoamine oxidase
VNVAIVGAGLAGLAAADALVAAGHEVCVLEARDRVGGRVWSQRLRNGAVVEMGAEFILPGNEVIVKTVRRLGLGLWEKGMAYGWREPRGGEPVTVEELRAAAALIERSLDPSVSAAHMLDRLELPPGVREAIRARVEVSTAVAADHVGADELAGVAAISDAPSHGIADGNQSLAEALAARHDVRLSSPVSEISWDGDGVEVDGRTADALVLAVPAPEVADITFAPELPARLRDALAGVRYGHAAKLFVPLRERPAPSAVLSVPERYWTWTARAGEDVQPVMHAFAGSRAALDRLGVADGPERWIESVARLRPDLALDPDGAVLSTWPRGAYSVHRPGGGDPALTERYGPLVLAGEYTAGPFAGLMEGALRSGARAADQLTTRQSATPAALQHDPSVSMNARSAGTGSRPSARKR